eukprot:5520237-Pyramimonas_sp.AAC.1
MHALLRAPKREEEQLTCNITWVCERTSPGPRNLNPTIGSTCTLLFTSVYTGTVRKAVRSLSKIYICYVLTFLHARQAALHDVGMSPLPNLSCGGTYASAGGEL